MNFTNGFTDELIKLGSATTYPVSRLLTSVFNPQQGFGLGRVIGSRGFRGRLIKGRVSKRDTKDIARILAAKNNIPYEKAMASAEKIVQKSKAGGFANAAKEKSFPVSRFVTSRSAMAGTNAGINALQAASLGAGPAGIAGVGGGLSAAASSHIQRVVGARGLAGRVAKGKKLFGSEKELLKMIDPSKKDKLLDVANKAKGYVAKKHNTVKKFLAQKHRQKK